VEGYSTPGGYSSKAVKPIALAKARRTSRSLEKVACAKRCAPWLCSSQTV